VAIKRTIKINKMSNIKKQVFLDFYQVVASVEDTFTSETRVEECHGEHTFEDTNIISQKILELKIIVGDCEIDILDRMTQDEINLLLKK
jgi:hypothetical protein